MCELLTQVRNKMIVVAYGVAEKSTPRETFLNMEISISYYAKVVVDRVVNAWDDLELEVPGVDGEQTLGEAMHGWILWPKAHIKITEPTLESSSAASAMPQGQDHVPSSPARKECSTSLESTPDDRDPSVSPPVLSKGSKRRAPPPPPKKQRKPKEKKPPPKLAYEKTTEELDETVRAELDAQIFKKKKPPVEKPIDQVKFHRFMRQVEEEKRKVPEKPPLSDYDRTALKM